MFMTSFKIFEKTQRGLHNMQEKFEKDTVMTKMKLMSLEK